MEFLNVLVAALVAWALGAAYYMTLAKPWMKAAGIPMDANGKPMGNGSPLPFLLSAIAMLVVAGMMRHVFAASGVASFGAGLVSGLGIGAFFISPWIMINNAYAMRPAMLTVIDSGYAILASGAIGAVLTLF